MPKIVKVKRTNVAGATPTLSYGEPAWNAADGRLFIGNAANQPVVVGASGSGSGATELYEYPTAASFPATGSSGRIYIATDVNRIYRWADVYVEVGPQ
jgi:hypothetical protein